MNSRWSADSSTNETTADRPSVAAARSASRGSSSRIGDLGGEVLELVSGQAELREDDQVGPGRAGLPRAARDGGRGSRRAARGRARSGPGPRGCASMRRSIRDRPPPRPASPDRVRNVTTPRAGARLPGTRAHRDRCRAASAPPRSPGQGGRTVRARGSEEELRSMSRSRKWSPRLAALLASAAIVFAACGGTASSTAPSAGAESTAPSDAGGRVQAPFEAMVYPETARPRAARPRRRMPTHSAVHRQLQEDQRDRREDRRLRAVQPGRRLPVEDRVHLVRDQ